MKTHFAIILMILVGILGFIIGYSMAPTDVAEVRHAVTQPAAAPASGQAASSSGGYGTAAPASGGYGATPAPSGGYGAPPPAGGYGAPPPAGGYGR
jgi:uncharacterized membrane protein